MEFKPPPRENYAHSSPDPEIPAAHTPKPASSTTNKAEKDRKASRLTSKPKQLILWLIVLILLIAAVGTAAYYINRYNQSQNQVKKLSNPGEAAKAEQQQLIDKVGQLTQLPKNETPTVATVTDVSKLNGQAFFVNAKNGDRVLIYTNAKTAYLYRPSTNKIINLAPVNLGSQPTGATSTTNAKP